MELAGLRIITIQSVSMRRRDDKRHNFVIGGPRDGYINVPPRYLQAALVYIHIIHNIPYAESRFSDWKERILRAWPKVLLYRPGLALQLPFLKISESMGNHDSKIVGACSVD